jgi:hypothetical protein
VSVARRRLAINWALVEQRRIAAGLSHSEFVARVGPCSPTGPGRLWYDSTHDEVPLRVLERICEVLDLHPAELFSPLSCQVADRLAAHATAVDNGADSGTDNRADLTDPAAAPPVAPHAREDVAVVEAAVAGLSAPVTTGQLADALGWPLQRTLRALATALDDTGIRLDVEHYLVRGLAARDGLLTSAQREDLHRAGATGQTMPSSVARALDQVVVYERAPEAFSDDDIRALHQHGLARHRAPGLTSTLTATEDVRFSLLLDEDPDEPGPDGSRHAQATDIFVTPPLSSGDAVH